MFEAGLFYTLLGLAFVIMFIKVPYKEFMLWLSAGIFIMLGFVVFSGLDVAFYIETNDGTNMINQTNYIIGNSTNTYNENGMFLAFILVILGIVTALIGLMIFSNPPKNRT